MGNTVKRITLRASPGLYEILDPADIYYLEADGHDTIVRTRRRRTYQLSEPLQAVAKRLPESFLRVHRNMVVNLDRVRRLRRRPGGDWELKLDPPVNLAVPVGRTREKELFRRIGRPVG
jgi:DNA-binding LytR/AlgR family response regulator